MKKNANKGDSKEEGCKGRGCRGSGLLRKGDALDGGCHGMRMPRKWDIEETAVADVKCKERARYRGENL